MSGVMYETQTKYIVQTKSCSPLKPAGRWAAARLDPPKSSTRDVPRSRAPMQIIHKVLE